MADTMTLISTVTVGSGGASSIDFTSIPSTYTDLCVKLSGRTTQAGVATGVLVRFNSSTTNYAEKIFFGNGSSASSASNGIGSQTGIYFFYTNGGNTVTNSFGNSELYVSNYASSNYKSISLDSVQEDNASLSYAILDTAIWQDTSVINSISLVSSSGSFVQYSTASLYGIKNS